tara:strand:+ start:150 stop:1457 length:1308 start_codon:yes stop_codon:yes gene_type:complete
MGLFDFLKKKKEPKEPISMEEYIKIRKDEGVSDDDIKEEIMDDFKSKMFGDKSSVSLDDGEEENDYMDTLPTPKGNFTEKGVEEIWDKSDLIEFSESEGDLEDVEYYKNNEIKEKEIYYYGKKIYKERFGEIVNSPLTDVIKNLSELIIDEYYEDDDYNFRVWEKLQIVGGNHKSWETDFYGVENKQRSKDELDDIKKYGGDLERIKEREKGYKHYFRKEICKSTEIITDEELVEFHQNNSGSHTLTWRETRLDELIKIKKIINKTFCIPHKEKHYNKETKSWSDFDINGIFLQIRSLMIVSKNPLPHYIWKLISGNPFDRVYRICRDYMKWKGNKKTTQIVFDNVCKWENGEIFREGEPQKEYEHPLWINWNKVGKDFLSMKTKLKKEGEGGLEWLKDDVGGYIKDRKNFYNSFGDESEYFISDELIGKFERIK